MNHGPTAWFRIDRNLPIHQLQTFPHAKKSQTATYQSSFGVEAFSFVTYGEYYSVWFSYK